MGLSVISCRDRHKTIPTDLLDQWLCGLDAKVAFEKDGLFDALNKARAERALNAESDVHLASKASNGPANRRNGDGRKAVLTDTGRLELQVPRNRMPASIRS